MEVIQKEHWQKNGAHSDDRLGYFMNTIVYHSFPVIVMY